MRKPCQVFKELLPSKKLHYSCTTKPEEPVFSTAEFRLTVLQQTRHAFWGNARQGFSMEKWVGERKFGPNYAVFRTPIDNMRLTAFFPGESEVRVVDPTKLELLETYGCKICAVSLEGTLY